VLVSLQSVCVVVTILSDLSLHMEYTVSECGLLSVVMLNTVLLCLTSLSVIIAAITKRMAWTRAKAQLSNTDRDMLRVISELLCFQHHYMNLDMFSMADVAEIIETLCTT